MSAKAKPGKAEAKSAKAEAKADEKLSRGLTKFLRHTGAPFHPLRVAFRPDGFALLSQVAAATSLAGATDLEAVRRVVDASEKQRLAIETDAAGAVWIRANQGHSAAFDGVIDPARVLQQLPSRGFAAGSDRDRAGAGAADIGVVVHGTYSAVWPLIEASGGLRPMQRQQVHFARGLGVKQGARSSADRYAFLNVRAALLAELPLWLSANGVVLSEGLPAPGLGQGRVPLALLSHAVAKPEPASDGGARSTLKVVWLGAEPALNLCGQDAATWSDLVIVAKGDEDAAGKPEGADAGAGASVGAGVDVIFSAGADAANVAAVAKGADDEDEVEGKEGTKKCSRCRATLNCATGLRYRYALTAEDAARVTELNFGGNARLTEIPAGALDSFTALQELALDHCGIVTLLPLMKSPGASPLAHLRELNLTHNRLEAIPDGLLSCLSPNLEQLRLAHNLLRSLPDDLGELAALVSLHVEHNASLALLPASLTRCLRLADLALEGTPLAQEEARPPEAAAVVSAVLARGGLVW